MEALAPLLQRPVIIALAVSGGVVALIGSQLLRRSRSVSPRVARFILRTGYAISWSSVGLFIIAGFIGA